MQVKFFHHSTAHHTHTRTSQRLTWKEGIICDTIADGTRCEIIEEKISQTLLASITSKYDEGPRKETRARAPIQSSSRDTTERHIYTRQPPQNPHKYEVVYMYV